MAIHKLHIDEFDEIDYQLIAIHTTLEDYRLAYYINQYLSVTLFKHKNSIQINNKEGEIHFSRFCYEDKKKDVFWDLIQNKNEIPAAAETNNQDLFSSSAEHFFVSAYLIPEYKKVDFFLKIDNMFSNAYVSKIIKNLKAIEQINTVYMVNPEDIKSKNNLIF